MKQFKIRASAGSQIMGENGLTPNQIDTITQYQSKEKLTVKQTETLNALIYKRDNPELPQGAKTYCKMWLKEQLYNRRKEFSNKYTQKGNIMEDNSFDFIAEQLDLGFIMKNEQYFENDFCCGTPDVVMPDLIIDAKNSWSWETFPLFEDEIDKNYFYQAQIYMELTGRKHFKLAYVLSDTPEHFIVREVRNYVYQNGIEEIDTDIYDSFVAKMTYPDVSDKLKLKVYDIEYCEMTIEAVKQRVEQCREYISELLTKTGV